MNRSCRCACLLAATLILVPLAAAFAQPKTRSPEVLEDGSVVFRFESRDDVVAVVQIAGAERPFERVEGGVWEATVEGLPPGIHDYGFQVNGIRMLDPKNRWVKKWLTCGNMVEIPGDPPLLTELQDVPHGVVAQVRYPSKSVDGDRPVVLYLPPGYDPKADREYPLLLLLHGFGDDETAWTEVGRAHRIADNLIAAGKIEPVVIAMPYGHPVAIPDGERSADYWSANDALYRRDLIDDLLPFLERHVSIRKDAASRSVAGLSMGGGHAIGVGLGDPDKFSAVGAFSAAAPEAELPQLREAFPSLDGDEPAANELKTFWIPIGESDFLLDRNRRFVERLNEAGVRHVYRESPGGHEWKLWREFLPEFLEMTVPAKP